MGITEEMLLKKFNGNKIKAAQFAAAYTGAMEVTNEEIKKLFDPEGPVMKKIDKDFGEYVDYMSLPWWKKVAFKLRLITLN